MSEEAKFDINRFMISICRDKVAVRCVDYRMFERFARELYIFLDTISGEDITFGGTLPHWRVLNIRSVDIDYFIKSWFRFKTKFCIASRGGSMGFGPYARFKNDGVPVVNLEDFLFQDKYSSQNHDKIYMPESEYSITDLI